MIGVNCFFIKKNIKEADTLDPFMHVYMFDIGSPPTLMEALSDIFNRSCSAYLICYHPPAIMIKCYDFNVLLLCTQKQLCMVPVKFIPHTTSSLTLTTNI